MRRVSLLLLFLTVGCATQTGVISLENDSYMVMRQGATGFTPLSNIKADTYTEAGAFCDKKGKGLQVVSSKEIAAGFGVYPSVELQFRCTGKQ